MAIQLKITKELTANKNNATDMELKMLMKDHEEERWLEQKN